jgi:adenylate cyclase
VTAEPVQRKLAAILSADVVGYSRLMAEDESATIRTLTDYREAIAMLVRQHRGRVVDSPGDNVLADFPSALEAVRCAVEIQRILQVRNADLPVERRMEFRVGVHLGDVAVEGERIYGDGINIAARLEGLAEAGGICISGMVHSQVRNKLDLGYEDLGDQSIKNLPEPVRVYRVQVKPLEGDAVEALPGMEELTVPGFSGQPAIAVLPFENLSGDPEQEYFADGIAEDLITRLSAWTDFPVIARNSSFTYKGKSVDVKQVSQELGARYVVEGSVRKAGDQVRVSAQLIDASTGHHVWAERYDRKLEDIFSLQDEITEALVGAMNPALLKSEMERAARKDPQNLDAYDAGLRALWHLWKFTEEDNTKARTLAERAIKLDPGAGRYFNVLAMTHYMDIFYQWTDSAARSREELFRVAQQGVKLDSTNAMNQWALAWAHSLQGQGDRATAAAELAVQLDPSLADAHFALGMFLTARGDADKGIAHVEKAVRLSPQAPVVNFYLHGIAVGHFGAGRYEEAVRWEQRSLQRDPDLWIAHGTLASSYAHLGRTDEARTALQEMLRRSPEFSLEAVRMIFSYVNPDFTESWIDGLRMAGLKE